MSVPLLIVVPARGGSKRLPGKNLRRLGGRTLLEWTAQAIVESELAAPCLLTTDDPAIAEAGRALGWLVPFLRPAELARDDTATFDAVLHALDWYRADRGADPRRVMLLQPTSPFRGGAVLRRAVEMLDADPGAQAAVAVRRLKTRADEIYAIDAAGYGEPVAPRAGPTAYVENGAAYLVVSEALRRTRSFFPPQTIPVEMDDASSLDLDTELDWRIAECICPGRAAA